MNQYSAIELAKQRMREIGKSSEEYHLDIVAIIGTDEERAAGVILIDGTPNRYFFWIDRESHKGFHIRSDYGYFNLVDNKNNTVEEFTGDILIERLPEQSWTLETMSEDGHSTIQHPVQFVRATF